MPTGPEAPERLVDTSVAVPLAVSDHAHHEAVLRQVEGRRLGSAGQDAFETFSVPTRPPPPTRRTPAAAQRLIEADFPHSRFLPAQTALALLAESATTGIAGGADCDALAGAAAQHHGVPLVTRDRRDGETYRALDAVFESVADEVR